LTSGARPRNLPAAIGGTLPGVVTIRGLADADCDHAAAQARRASRRGRRRVYRAGGAAVTAAKGMQVTVIEAADRILQRVAAAETSAYFRELHQRHGVTISEPPS